MRRIVPLVIPFLYACNMVDSRFTQRYENKSQGYSVAQPNDAWTESVDRGATVFTTVERQKHTIVVRSTARPDSLGENAPCTMDNLAAATKRVLLGMPGAKMVRQDSPEGTELPAKQFVLTFRPSTGKGKLYQRHDAVVLGEKHIFHVIYTAPATDTIDEQTLNEMIQTIREGV